MGKQSSLDGKEVITTKTKSVSYVGKAVHRARDQWSFSMFQQMLQTWLFESLTVKGLEINNAL